MSLSYKKPRFDTPVTSEKFCDAATTIVHVNMTMNNAWAVKTFTACLLACLLLFFAVEYSRSVMAFVHSALFSLIGRMENRALWLENRALWFYM